MGDRKDRAGQIFGDYRLVRWLGGGGFGDVYLAEQVRNHTPVAVKILPVRLFNQEELKAFINEARTMRLKHPHIVPLLDFGIGDKDMPFLVMEYAPGGTLRDKHPKGQPLPLTLVNNYISQVGSALQYAHEQRLIHRDIKPDNMLIRADGTILLSDFGIVTVAQSSHSVNLDRSVGGTLPYMAPEQIRGHPRAASDQYALAIVAYEWLAGKRPFEGTTVEIALQQETVPPPPFRVHVPELPVEVEQVVMTALAKDPKERFASVAAFVHALQQASQEIPQPVQRLTPVTPIPEAPPPSIVYKTPTFPLESLVPDALPAVAFQQPVSAPALFTDATQRAGFPATGPQQTTFHTPGQMPQIPRKKSHGFWTTRKVILCIVLALLLVGGGLGTLPFILRSHTPSALTPTPAPTTQTIVSPTLKWHYSTGGSIFSTPAVANGLIYVSTDDGNLSALDALSGQKKWSFTAKAAIHSSPVVANGLVYVGSDDGTLYALDASNGHKKWSYRAGAAIRSTPALVNDLLYVGTDNRHIYALDALNGHKKWDYQAGAAIRSSLAVANGLVYAGADNGYLYALDALSGSLTWSHLAGVGEAIRVHPLIANNIVYIGSENGSIYALDALSGDLKWSHATGGHIESSPLVVSNTVCLGSYDGTFYALDALSGNLKWSFRTKNSIASSPAVDKNIIYVSSDDGNLYALNALSGSKKWAYATGAAIRSSPVVANGLVYVGTNNGNLYALQLP